MLFGYLSSVCGNSSYSLGLEKINIRDNINNICCNKPKTIKKIINGIIKRILTNVYVVKFAKIFKFVTLFIMQIIMFGMGFGFCNVLLIFFLEFFFLQS